MSTITQVLSGFKTRISTYTTAGSALSEIKTVKIGSIDESRSDIDLPAVSIIPVDSVKNYKYQPHGASETMTVRVKLIGVKKEGSDTLTSGIYATLEKLLNCIEKNPTTGQVDLHLGNTIQNLPGYTYRVYELDRYINIEIDFEVETQDFTLGAR